MWNDGVIENVYVSPVVYASVKSVLLVVYGCSVFLQLQLFDANKDGKLQLSEMAK